MSRTPASYSMKVVRGSTWEDEFVYTEDDQVTPIDMTGYEARMQVRTAAGQYGLSTTDTLVLELTTGNGLLYWDTAPDGRLRIKVEAADTLHGVTMSESGVSRVLSVKLSEVAAS